jgi:hypothetical protein
MPRLRRKYAVSLLLLVGLIAPAIVGQAQDPPRDPRFGVVEAFWDTGAAVEAGVAWERILFQWSQIQPNSPDDWNTLHVPDEWLQWAQAQGREIVGLLKNTPHWATDADPPMEASPPRGLELPVDDPGNTWATFVRRVVEFYGPRGVHRWIIWNEPDIAPGVYGQEWAGSVAEYFQLLKVAYQVIKQTDPGAQVHLAGLTYWHDQGWLGRFLAVATADPEGPAHAHFFDVVSLHIYFQTDSVDLVVNQIRATLAAYGLNKPIWINETNASPDSDPQWPLERPRWRVDLREQASFILQGHALGLAAGAERIGVYRLIDAGLPPGGEPFGLLRPDHSRRPAYDAYRLVTQHYAGTRSARVSREPSFAQVTLNRGERTTRVLWARTRSDVSVTIPAFAAQAILIDQGGNAQPLDGSSGSYQLALPGARCADEILGCIIGGPTILLVEEAPAGGVEAPAPVVETPTTDVGQEGATPTVATSENLTPTVTVQAGTPTLVLTATATATATATEPPTPSATATASATPSPTATHTRTPTTTPSATPSATASATPSPSPSPRPTATPSPTPGAGITDRVGPMTLGGLTAVLLLGLVGLGVWRTRQRQ